MDGVARFPFLQPQDGQLPAAGGTSVEVPPTWSTGPEDRSSSAQGALPSPAWQQGRKAVQSSQRFAFRGLVRRAPHAAMMRHPSRSPRLSVTQPLSKQVQLLREFSERGGKEATLNFLAPPQVTPSPEPDQGAHRGRK